MKYWVIGAILLFAGLFIGHGQDKVSVEQVNNGRLTVPYVPIIPEVEFSPGMVRSGKYDLGKRGLLVFESKEEYLSFTDGQGLLPLTDTDFQKTFVVLISYGRARSGGYKVEVKEAKISEDTLNIVADFQPPLPGTMVTQAIEYPFTLFAVKKGKNVKRIVLLDEEKQIIDAVEVDHL